MPSALRFFSKVLVEISRISESSSSLGIAPSLKLSNRLTVLNEAK